MAKSVVVVTKIPVFTVERGPYSLKDTPKGTKPPVRK